MKQLISFLVSILFVSIAGAQTYDSVPPYLKTKELPSFNILQTDSSWFRLQNLPVDKPTAIIYFNPECGHCQETAQKISESMEAFKDVTFLWVTYLSPLEEIETFKKNFKLDGYSNVHFGKDPQYYIPSYFRVEVTPFVALYDTQHQLVKAWPMYFTVNDLKKNLKR